MNTTSRGPRRLAAAALALATVTGCGGSSAGDTKFGKAELPVSATSRRQYVPSTLMLIVSFVVSFALWALERRVR
jgi:hypothetical protein